MGGSDPVEMSPEYRARRSRSFLSFVGIITACVEENGGAFTVFSLISSSFTINCLFQQWLAMLWWQQGFLGSTSDCGMAGGDAGSGGGRALEGCAAGDARAVDLQ